jgi:hypothetical protein
MWGISARAVAITLAALGLCARLANAEQKPPDFRFEIRPILSKNCFACHGPDEAHRQADLRLDERDAAVDFGAIVPGQPDESELIRRILSTDPDEQMPPADSGRKLTSEEIEKIKLWVAEGADYSRHWSYEPPQRREPPKVSRPDWCRNEIDRFVLSRLDEAGLTPEVEADRHRLIRRLSLDLIGLPPTIEEVDAFVADESPEAYECLVDKLLASPAYGEHWARKWLDLARYADTTGYEKDTTRKIWSFRDWVINALNTDMPFDQFTLEQLAGDLLPNATQDQIVATAFHRNTMQNDEGGTDNEEYRVAAVIDRVNTTMQVWMATTMGCCQCHTHKYDPFPHREYYELFAFFNQTADEDRYDQEPLLLTPTPEQKQLKAELDRQLEAVNKEYDAQVAALSAAQRDWEQQVGAAIDWKPLRPTQVMSKAGATCTLLDDGSVLVSGTAPDTDTYTIQGNIEVNHITAIRLEALPHDSLPNGGPGRAEDGSFVISKLEVFQEPVRPAEGVRFVRVELPRHDYLTMSEVEVFSGDENVALTGTATQSSTAYEGHAKLAIDGSTHPEFATGRSISHTAFNDNPWWEVDLGKPTNVDRVALWNEGAHPDRLGNSLISLLDQSRKTIWQHELIYSPNLATTITVDEASTPQFEWAIADSERKDFAAASAIENNDPKLHGWSPDLSANGPQSIVLGLKDPIVAAAGSAAGNETGEPPVSTVRIVIDHRAQLGDRKRQTLGHFRILVTDDPHARAKSAPPAIRNIAAISAQKRTPDQTEQLTKYFQSQQPALKKLVAQREDIERRLTEEYKPDKTPIMKELVGNEQRKTHLLIRGSFLNPGEEVSPDTPKVFPALADDLPRNRLGLAKWLVDRENPLTARVVANRQWEQLFGTGIVLTSEDFGSQGMLPTHPELLDWLAIELMDNGWSLKKLTKKIVMSAAYRQSSRTPPEKLARDPDNRLISRGPRDRLSAEQIRDQALAVSGLLSRKLGGPSVMPLQPDGVWQVVYSDDRWQTSRGEDRYRRGLYTFWRRTNPYPSAMALDATSRETCTIRRISTNTPIAAFALLNDPVYVEAAQSLAKQIMQHASTDSATRATYAFRQVLARQPAVDEVQRLVALYDSERKHYEQNVDAATKMAVSEISAQVTEVSHLARKNTLADLAAWTVVSNVLLNLDETLNN